MSGKLLAAAAVVIALAPISPAGAQNSEYANIHTIAVASAIGDTYTLFNFGLTIFDTSAEKIPIPDWQVDAWMTDAIAKALSSRFQIKQIPLSNPAFAGCDGREQCADALPHRDDVDAYVIAIKHQLAAGARPGQFWGLGQDHRSFLGMHIDSIYAGYEIVVVDAKSGKVIDHGSAKLSGGSPFFADEPVAGFFPPSIWPESAAQMTDDQKAFAKKTVMDILVRSLPYGLTNANLIPPPEATNDH